MGILDSLTNEVADFLDPGDIMGRGASEEAYKIQVRLLREALGLRKGLFKDLRKDAAPVRAARDEVLGMIGGLRDGTHSLALDPSLGYQTDEALKNIRNQAAARGKFNSGGRFMAEQDAIGSLTSQSVNQSMNRLLNSAGFNTSDLTTNNQLLQRGANGVAQDHMGLATAQFNQNINRQNMNNDLQNSLFTLGAYYGS